MSVKRKLAIILLVFCMTALALADGAHALTFEYQDYIVQKGDTLWGISKAHLQDSFQWPMIWRENLRINNPDLIYPGQLIRIPIRIIGPTVLQPQMPEEPGEPMVYAPVEEPAAEPEPVAAIAPEPVVPKRPATYKMDVTSRKAEPIVTREVLMQAGFITKMLFSSGTITRHAIGRSAFSVSDIIYVDLKNNAAVGQKFFAMRKAAEVTHPITGKPMGWHIKVLGTLEIIEAGKTDLKARVIEAFEPLEVGDLLDPYYDIVPPFVLGEPRTPDITGNLVALHNARMINGKYDMVFLDKGTNDGVENGDVFQTYILTTDDQRNAIIQIVNTRKETSLGVVERSEQELKVGEQFSGIK